jgi:hypothetical protein
MILLAAAAAASFSAPPAPSNRAAAVVQATAIIRVISGVQVKFGAPSNPGAPPPRETAVKAADGTIHPAKLIEFQ